MEKNIIVAEKLTKTFTVGEGNQTVINALSLNIKEGDFTVIMGASGSGKSTLLYALSGMDKPSSGRIFFENMEIQGYNNDKLAIFRRENCGFVFQSIYLLPNLNVIDNVLAAGLLLYRPKQQLVAHAKELLNQVGIGPSYWTKYPNHLSGGERQRVAIVRAIVNTPKVVFADEPTGALNSASSNDVLDVMTNLNNNGQSMVVVTHDIKTALRANRLMYFRDGRVAGELSMDTYAPAAYSTRFEKVNHFLNDMGW